MAQKNVKTAKCDQNNNARDGNEGHQNKRGQIILAAEDIVVNREKLGLYQKTVRAESM